MAFRDPAMVEGHSLELFGRSSLNGDDLPANECEIHVRSRSQRSHEKLTSGTDGTGHWTFAPGKRSLIHPSSHCFLLVLVREVELLWLWLPLARNSKRRMQANAAAFLPANMFVSFFGALSNLVFSLGVIHYRGLTEVQFDQIWTD